MATERTARRREGRGPSRRRLTGRRRAEEALRESEERFRSAFEHAATGMALVRPDGRLLQVNRACQEALGYSEEELRSTTWQALTHPDDVELTQRHVNRVLAGESDSFQIEKRFIHKQGHVLWGHLTSSLLRDADGKPLYFITQVQDITARKRAEEELRRSEERFRAIAEAAPIPMVITRLSDGLILHGNAHLGPIFGLPSEEVIGRKAPDFYYDPADRQVLLDLLKREGYVRDYEVLAKKADGTPFWVVISIQAITFEGQPALIAGFYDVTERKRVEEALRLSDEMLRQMPDAILVTDLDGNILRWMGKAEQIFGYTAEEAVGRPVSFLHRPDIRETMTARIIEQIQGTGMFFGEIPCLRKDGSEVPIETTAKAVYDEEGRPVALVGINKDISERKRAEQALRESEERYRRLVELSPYGIAVHSEEKVAFVNRAGLQLLGAANPSEIVGRPIWDFVHPDYMKAVKKRIQGTRLEEWTVDLAEEKWIRLDGQVIDVEVAAIPITYQGKPARQVVFRDITARKRMEEALQKTREDLESMVERQMERGNCYGLTFRELTVLHLMAVGRSDKEIASVLGISILTAHKHVASILAKMGVGSRTEASVRAVREGLLDEGVLDSLQYSRIGIDGAASGEEHG